MKKIYLLSLLILISAVFLSGCLAGETNLTSPDDITNPSDSNQTPLPAFNADLTLVDPVPPSLSFLSTASVRSHGQHIGVTDAIFGYQGIYTHEKEKTPIFLTYYNVGIANTTKTAVSYIQMMKDSHIEQYGANSNITTIQINGHDAVLFKAETDDAPQYGRYMLAWTIGDDMFVTVTGTADSAVLIELATATGY